MVFEAIQSIIQMYSMPLLYAIVLWFGVIGFVARVAMVMILTRVKGAQMVPVSLRLHLVSLVFAYLIAPTCAIITTGLNSFLFAHGMKLGLNSNLYVWYSVVMISVLRYLLCQTFVSVSCNRWQIGLIATDGFVAILGYLFLSAMQLI